MNQQVKVTLFGFKIGRYMYYWKKKQLYRFNDRRGSHLLLKLQLYGGSLRYKIQGCRYSYDELRRITTTVVIFRFVPF